MTTREEIREEIARDYLFPWVHDTGAKWDKMPEVVRTGYRNRASRLLTYLHSQGIVLKVDRELPQVTEEARGDRKWIAAFICGEMEMLKAGYVAVEPLIEDDK